MASTWGKYSTSPHRIASLDWLRAIAITMVVISHLVAVPAIPSSTMGDTMKAKKAAAILQNNQNQKEINPRLIPSPLGSSLD